MPTMQPHHIKNKKNKNKIKNKNENENEIVVTWVNKFKFSCGLSTLSLWLGEATLCEFLISY